MDISPETFAALCYVVLQNNHGQGVLQSSPGYILEKLVILDAGYEAYSYLDRVHQTQVLLYLAHWKCKNPPWVQQYEDELRELRADE